MKRFKAIAAMSLNRVIGRGNQIPWHLPEDFKWFKQMTTGQVVVMGRKTFDSLPRPLPKRRTVILTRNPQRLIESRPELFGAYELQPADGGIPGLLHFLPRGGQDPQGGLFLGTNLESVRPEDFPGHVFICGGAELYRLALGACSELYLTLVKRECEGDVVFPEFEDRFGLVQRLRETEQFDILHYRNRTWAEGPEGL